MNLPLPAADPSLTLHVGFEMAYECPQPTPMILALNVHYSRSPDLLYPDRLSTLPAVPVTAYRDLFGNWCSRLVAPRGLFVIRTDALLRDSGDEHDFVQRALDGRRPAPARNLTAEEQGKFQQRSRRALRCTLLRTLLQED